ncbi:NDxxF motif lipoprotein [Niallia circulans]
MKRIFYSILILFLLSACSKGGGMKTEEEIVDTNNVKIPSTIFYSDKQNSVIDEEEMKSSIKTYLDTHEELYLASSLFKR